MRDLIALLTRPLRWLLQWVGALIVLFEEWGWEPLARLMAHTPSYMMWDDHDIIDGWGSHSAELHHSPVFQGLFQVAKAAFELFQRQMLGAPPPATLPGQTALVLAAAPIERRLCLGEGVLWITRTREACPVGQAAAADHEAIDLPGAWDDHWLVAGEQLRLPAHAEFVLEAWPTARFAVQEVPPASWRRAAAGRGGPDARSKSVRPRARGCCGREAQPHPIPSPPCPPCSSRS